VISVVIPSRNRADLLSLTLSSIVNQELSRAEFEVIVVDNGSTDHTQSVVKDYQSRLTNLIAIYAPEPGLHTGRHAGMTAAKGDVLVFADDDIEALPTWLSAIQDVFKDPSVAMAGGNNLPMFLQEPPAWLSALWNKTSSDGGRSVSLLSIQQRPAGRYDISPYQVWGCNFAIRKNVLAAVGGFHPDGMPQDLIRFRGDGETYVSTYVLKNRLRCVFDSNASVYHKVTPERMTLQYFRQRGFNQGVSDSYTQLRGEHSFDQSKPSVPYRIARWCWHRLRGFAQTNDQDQSYQPALDEYKAGHKEGYKYHQAAYRNDSEVRAWVHRANYM
jgi:glucosyl-dolichyl phosphate glucuronosyltransferase